MFIMDPKVPILFSMLIYGYKASDGAKCKFQLPQGYVNTRPIDHTPTVISVAMVVSDLVKVDDDELSYTIDIAYVVST